MAKPKRKRKKATANPRRRRRTNRASASPRRRRRVTSNPRRRRRSNSKPKVVVRYRARRRNRRRANHRNPMPMSILGVRLSVRSIPTLIGGGLVGVAWAKIAPNWVPASMQIGGNAGRAVFTLAAAWVGGWLGSMVNADFGGAVFFGGLMQTGSVILNAVLPGFSVGGVPLALNGMGELVPGRFAVPQNPIRAAIAPPAVAVPAQARVTMNGLARAYGTAF